MHLARLVVQLDRPEQLHVLGRGGRKNRFVLLPCRALDVRAVGQPVRLALSLGVDSGRQTKTTSRHERHCPCCSHSASLVNSSRGPTSLTTALGPHPQRFGSRLLARATPRGPCLRAVTAAS